MGNQRTGKLGKPFATKTKYSYSSDYCYINKVTWLHDRVKKVSAEYAASDLYMAISFGTLVRNNLICTNSQDG
jgi:hypothetical protein